jgi:hypothetical protein
MTGRSFTKVVALIFKAVHDPEKSFASARPSMMNEHNPSYSRST